jgi:hypothetical protein
MNFWNLPLPSLKYRAFQKDLYNGVADVAVWRVLRKRLQLKAALKALSDGQLVRL